MATINGFEIDLRPTEAMRVEAQKYRQWKADGLASDSMIEEEKALQIISGQELAPDQVLEIEAWFKFHEDDKKIVGFRQGEEGYPIPERVAWSAFGGDPGQLWSYLKEETIEKINKMES